jgi:transposase
LNLKDFACKNIRFEAEVIFEVKKENNSTWYLATNLGNQGVAEMYESRFKIEKLFQDLKSSGYNIENTKIRKYDRIKRMLYLSCLSYAYPCLSRSLCKVL